jgi:hypothetical protein
MYPLGRFPTEGAGALAEDDDAACAGSGGIYRIPVGNCTTGDDGALGPPANGSAVPLALVAAPAITTGSAASLSLPDALGSPADANGLAGEHKAMDEGSGGNACAAIMDGAMGDRLPSPMATGGTDPLASHTALDGSDDGGDAPPEFSPDVGLPANESGLTGIGDATDAGSGGIGDDPTQQLTALYPLFCRGNAEAGRRLVAAVGWMRTAPWESHPPAAVAVLPVNAGHDATGILPAGGITKGVAQRALGSTQAGRTTKGVALHALGLLLSRAVVDTGGTAAASAVRPGTAVWCTDGCAGGTCTGGHARTFVLATIIAATAPTVANSYTHSAHGTVADMGGAAGGAVGDVVAPDDATPATARVAPEGDTPPAGSLVQSVHGHSLPSTFTEAELREADPQLQRLTTADWRLLGIFGDTIHLNNGTHLDGGIGAAEDAKWQRLYNRVAACSLPLYNLLNGCWAHCFLTADRPLGRSHSAVLELGAAIGIPGGHPPPHPRDHSIPQR